MQSRNPLSAGSVFAAALLLGVTISGPAPPQTLATKPNVILILPDDFG
jgi:hypothetical protein